MDIKSHLLLNSDLRGEIEQPGYYFYSDDPHRKRVLDLLMMTQGWREFILNETLSENDSKRKFPHETGIRFEGNVKRFNDHGKSVSAEVSLTYSNNKETAYSEVKTDDQGHFVFEGYDFEDSTSIVIQAKSIKIKKGLKKSVKTPNMNFFIEMDSSTIPNVSINRFNETFNNSYSNNSIKIEENDSMFGIQNKVIMLDEIIVESDKPEERKTFQEKKVLYIEPSHHVDFENIRNEMFNMNVLAVLEGRIPGMPSGGFTSLSLETEPLYLLDGIPVHKSTIISFPISNVHYVDVLKRAKAAIYGSSGVNGVIAVYTLDASDILRDNKNKERRGILSFVHPGYSQTRKFYEPVYKSKKTEQNKLNNQSTIYWNPKVKLDQQGEARISFYSSDVSTTYRVILEGITLGGDIIKSEIFFEVK